MKIKGGGLLKAGAIRCCRMIYLNGQMSLE